MSEETQKICPRCANAIKADAKQCNFCGAQFVITVRGLCPNGHGYMKADGNGNCPLCNAALDGRAMESQLVSAPSLSQPASLPPEMAQNETSSEVFPSEPQPAGQSALPPEAWLSAERPAGEDIPGGEADQLAIEQLDAALAPPPVELRVGRSIQRRLQAEERPIYRARRHPAGLIGALLSLALGAAIFLAYGYLAALPASTLPAALLPPGPGATLGEAYRLGMYVFYLVALVFVLAGLSALVGLVASELVVTNQRILGRYGGLFARRVDIPLADIVTVVATHAVSPFNLGRLMVTRTDRRVHLFNGLANQQEFRQQVESQFPPGPRPLVKKASFVRILGTALLALVLLGGSALLIYLAASGEYRHLQPVVSTTFDTFSQFPVGQRVVIVGLLEMPDKTACDDDCYVLLRDNVDPSRTLAVFISTPASGEPGPNQMRSLPEHFEEVDFQVVCADGSLAGDGAALRLTGLVCRTASGDPCLNEVRLIELVSP